MYHGLFRIVFLCTNELHIMRWVALIVLRQMHSSILHGLIYLRHLANAWKYVVTLIVAILNLYTHAMTTPVTAKPNKPQTCFGCPTRCQTELHARRQNLSGTPSRNFTASRVAQIISLGQLSVVYFRYLYVIYCTKRFGHCKLLPGTVTNLKISYMFIHMICE